MSDTPRQNFLRRALAQAERMPVASSRDPNEYSKTRHTAIVQQVRESLDRVIESERATAERLR